MRPWRTELKTKGASAQKITPPNNREMEEETKTLLVKNNKNYHKCRMW